MILVCVFDGLRPDLIDAAVTPHLWALRARGAWFERSHCVFPSVTRVNAASLATGSLPAAHGIPANTLCLPDADGQPAAFVNTADDQALRALRGADGAALLGVETLAETLARAGLRTAVVSTGSPGSAYLLHPEVARVGGVIFHHGFCEPAELRAWVSARLGPPPAAGTGAIADLVARVEYAARALSDVIQPEVAPALALFWCTVPDALHHRYGLASPEATAGLAQVDAIFGRLLAALERSAGAPLDVLVTSDHGYATVDRHVDVAAALAAAPFARAWPADAWSVAVDGGAGQIALAAHQPGLAEAIVRYLNEQAWIGAVFARDGVAAALSLTEAGVACARAADLLFCFAWSAAVNRFGVPGLSVGGGGIAVGAGDHGGASPLELRNTLLAAGPAFRPGVYGAPAGIIDLAPTVCRVLSVPAPLAWSGRTLTEALQADGREPDEREERITGEGCVATLSCAHAAGARYVTGVVRQ